jgi:hypothetical protein
MPPWLLSLAAGGDARTPHVPGRQYQAEPELIAAALAVLPNADEDWETWNTVGMAIFRASGGAGFAIFDGWSQKSAKYDARVTAEKWAQYFRCPPNRIGAGSLFHWANTISPGWSDAFWRQVEETFIAHPDPETRLKQIAWMQEHVWK